MYFTLNCKLKVFILEESVDLTFRMFYSNVNTLESTGSSVLVKTSTYKAGHVASALLLVILVRSRTGKLYSGSVKV